MTTSEHGVLHLGQKFINEDKAAWFNALKHEQRNCEQYPALDDEPSEVEVSMEIEEQYSSEDECHSEDVVSQRQAEDEFKLKKLLQREERLKGQVSRALW